MKSREIVEISKKGQLLIPKFYRDKTGIKPGSKVALSVDSRRLIVNPLPRDPIEASRGFLTGDVSLARELLKERRAETKKEKRIRR
ncbi:MAG TPA: AbrB/MazE/SpoVT family DNA-binding domain-containing protein [Acidobacteriota bacterium]|nr:AbrB/MazE/SpoVT family DNA-binding domain-containing protein [Acidobacteriota bacterium]